MKLAVPKRINVDQLVAELVLAGIETPRGLGVLGDPATDVYTFTDAGAAAELPPGADLVVELHVAQDPVAETRTAVAGLLGSTIGLSLAELTALQQRALLAALLWRSGALTPGLRVRPLSEWLRPGT